MNITIENENYLVELSTLGAEIQHFTRKADGTDFIWHGDESVWKNHAPILFPFIGRPVGGYFMIDGKKCEYSKNHGFVRQSETKVILQEKDRAVFELTDSAETLARYPYHFSLQAEYKLSGNTLEWNITVKNTDTRKFKFAVGTHAAFACPRNTDAPGTQNSDYVIEFENREELVGAKCTPEGYLASDENGNVPVKFIYGEKEKGFVPLTKDGFGNGHFFTDFSSKWIGLRNKKDNSLVKISTDGFKYCMLWQNTSGEPNFVCIEPWHGLPEHDKSDHQWDTLPGMNTLEPGESFTSSQNISVE